MTNPYQSPNGVPGPQRKLSSAEWLTNPWHPVALVAVLIGICLSALVVMVAGVIHGL